MKTLLLIFLILFTFFVNGQTTQKSEVAKEKFLTIKMQKYPIVDDFETSKAISDIQVIQLVSDSFRLGYSTKGWDNYVATIRSDKNLTDFLQQHLTRMYKNQYKKKGRKILLVIKELREGEKDAYIPYAYHDIYTYTKLNADTYISEDGNLFTKVYNVDSVFVNQLNITTREHAESIEKSLKFIVKKTILYGETASEKIVEGITIDQIVTNCKPKLDAPILTSESYKDGAYKNFEEFLNNNPSITDFEPIASKKKKIDILNAAKDTIAIWGFCKNGEIYKYYEKALVPIEKQGNGFMISDYVENKTRRNKNLNNASLMGSLAGGAIGSVINVTAWFREGQPLLVKSYSYIDDAKHQPEAVSINMKNGEFSF
jgi:hypothetical protein